jgi:hypothetical protein
MHRLISQPHRGRNFCLKPWRRIYEAWVFYESDIGSVLQWSGRISLSYLVSTLLFGAIIWWFALGPGRKAGDALSPLTRKLIGAVAGGAAIFLLIKGRWDIGILLGSLAAWLLGVKLPAIIDPIGRARRSQIRTSAMLIEIDLGDGAMNAKILAGAFRGKTLAGLTREEIVPFARELTKIDPQGLLLIVQELDRRLPGWRQHVQLDADARGGQASGASGTGELRDQEAYQILGLEAGASEEAIRAAHRALIGRIHPDRGGSTHLAALVNRAKDVALAAKRRG